MSVAWRLQFVEQSGGNFIFVVEWVVLWPFIFYFSFYHITGVYHCRGAWLSTLAVCILFAGYQWGEEAVTSTWGSHTHPSFQKVPDPSCTVCSNILEVKDSNNRYFRKSTDFQLPYWSIYINSHISIKCYQANDKKGEISPISDLDRWIRHKILTLADMDPENWAKGKGIGRRGAGSTVTRQ